MSKLPPPTTHLRIFSSFLLRSSATSLQQTGGTSNLQTLDSKTRTRFPEQKPLETGGAEGCANTEFQIVERRLPRLKGPRDLREATSPPRNSVVNREEIGMC